VGANFYNNANWVKRRGRKRKKRKGKKKQKGKDYSNFNIYSFPIEKKRREGVGKGREFNKHNLLLLKDKRFGRKERGRGGKGGGFYLLTFYLTGRCSTFGEKKKKKLATREWKGKKGKKKRRDKITKK